MQLPWLMAGFALGCPVGALIGHCLCRRAQRRRTARIRQILRADRQLITAGYRPDPGQKPLTAGHQPTQKPKAKIVPPPPPRRRGS